MNDGTRQAVAEARPKWDTIAGQPYSWGYTETGEGMATRYCIDGIAGNAGAQNADVCGFNGETGVAARGIDDYFQIITDILAIPDSPGGRTVDATFDPTTGHPLRIFISGGETDSLEIQTINFSTAAPE